MISIVVLGSGNVATHLINTFLKIDSINLKQVYTRNLSDLETLKVLVPTTNCLTLLKKADITVVAVSDDAIATVSSFIENPFVVHTSGSMEMDVLKNKGNKGVFYPLQSFSKEKKILNFGSIPICIEAENSTGLYKLKILASLLQAKTYILNSSQRRRVHIAAVFVNNFANHMYTIANDICEKNQIPFHILYPLIEETTEKIRLLPPKKAQTGPAKRKDSKTIENHLNLLPNSQKELYLKITKSIQHMEKNYKEHLAKIDTLIFDVDGVLTNGSVTIMSNGELVRQMNIKDGYALRAATSAGLRIFVISGGNNEGVKIRLKNLGVQEVFMGANDKTKYYNSLLAKYHLSSENVLYMGDDIPDLPVMKLVGFPCCPSDASEEIQKIASYVSYKKGGEGCVREIIEQILRVQGKWKGNYDATYD